MDSTKNEIPDGKLSFDIDVPKAEDLELEGTAAVNSAEFLVISDEDGLKRATFEMNAYTKRIKELEKARKNYEGQMRKLSNENFISRAPEAVVQTERERAEKAKALVENLEASLKNLG